MDVRPMAAYPSAAAFLPGTNGLTLTPVQEPLQYRALVYTLSQVIPLAVMILIGLLFYALGRRTREEPVSGTATATPATDFGS
jgi:hypothetical protein